MTAVDTNILFYAHDRRDERKRQIAAGLIESLSDGVLLWQVACEYLWTSRKLESQDYSYADALADVDELRIGWETALPTWAVLDNARVLRGRGFSHWDSLLVAACLDAGVTTLYSEDFDSRVRIEGIWVVNPFG
jgi:predicted nucleic acid-binding protein